MGYRLTEWALPLDQTIYVLGEAQETGQQLVIRKPSESDTPFIISTKSEEQLVATARKWVLLTKFGGLAGAVLAIVLIVTGIALALA